MRFVFTAIFWWGEYFFGGLMLASLVILLYQLWNGADIGVLRETIIALIATGIFYVASLTGFLKNIYKIRDLRLLLEQFGCGETKLKETTGGRRYSGTSRDGITIKVSLDHPFFDAWPYPTRAMLETSEVSFLVPKANGYQGILEQDNVHQLNFPEYVMVSEDNYHVIVKMTGGTWLGAEFGERITVGYSLARSIMGIVT